MAILEASDATDVSPKQAATSTVTPRRQISLRGLFLCVTYFAVSSALATKFGLGIFVAMNGIFLTWLSFRGYLWWMQTNRARPKTFGLGWLLFAISFGLPACTIKGCGSGPPTTYYGWEAALMTVGTVEDTVRDTKKLLQQSSERTWEQAGSLCFKYILLVLTNLPNLLMLVSPYLLYRQQHNRGRVLSVIFGCAMVCSWTWGVTMGTDLRIGYYVWSIGITMIGLARPPGWRSLAAMGGVGGIWLILGQLSG